MTDSQRQRKKFIIAVVYITIFLSIVGVLVFWLFPYIPPAPPAKTQAVEPLLIEETAVLRSRDGYADVYAKIKNPNNNLGVALMYYTFTFKNQSTGELVKKEGVSFILPGETKYVVELEYPVAQNQVLESFSISEDLKWDELDRFSVPKLVVRDIKYGPVDKPGLYYTLSAILANEEGYDLDKIDLVGVLLNKNNEVIGINKTILNTFRKNQQRYFEMIWNFPIPQSEVSRVAIYPSSNVLVDANFLKVIPDGPVGGVR
jgi:hypothetical protein